MTSSAPKRIEGLDTIRALAAGLVLLHHAHALSRAKLSGGIEAVAQTGWVGVEIFFAISGFILLLPWARDHWTGRRADMRRFAENRARRILPAYYFNLFTILMFTAPALLVNGEGLENVLLHVAFMATLPGADGSPLANPILNAIYWTLAAELVFYFTLPLVYRWFVGRRWVWSVPVALGLIILTKFALHAWWLGQGMNDAGLHRVAKTFPFVADEFLGGMVLAAIWAELEHRAVVVKPIHQHLAAWIGVAGVAGTLYAVRKVVGSEPYWSGDGPFGMWPLFCLKGMTSAFAAVAIFGFCWSDTVLNRVLRIRPLPWLGTVSYGLYLWQLPIQKQLLKALPKGTDPQTVFAWLIGPGTLLVVAWACLSYYGVEQPFLRRRPAPRRTPSEKPQAESEPSPPAQAV